MSDIFEKLNDLNIVFAKRKLECFHIDIENEAFIKKISMWLQKIVNSSYEMFACMEDFIQKNELGFDAMKPLDKPQNSF